jgi:hypothetical protein
MVIKPHWSIKIRFAVAQNNRSSELPLGVAQHTGLLRAEARSYGYFELG